MAENSGVILVEESAASIAGAVVWWELSGSVATDKLEEAAALEGLPEHLCPAPPSAVVALSRAASKCLEHNRQLVRPLRTRGEWEIVEEALVRDEETGRDRTRHERLASGWIDRDSGKPNIAVHSARAQPLASAILSNFEVQRGQLSGSDAFAWFIDCAERGCSAVPLRQRGGFYFIPRDELELWDVVERTVRLCSSHELRRIPAMRTDDAVEAVLASVRAEAEALFKELEAYMAGEVSSKGVNACQRRVAQARAKLDKYAALLGVALLDLVDRAQLLQGAAAAAALQLRTPE
jgi:hypothetical protein